MNTTTLFVAVAVAIVLVALVVIGLVFWNGRRHSAAQRRAQAEELREQLRREDLEVRQRDSLDALDPDAARRPGVEAGREGRR